MPYPYFPYNITYYDTLYTLRDVTFSYFIIRLSKNIDNIVLDIIYAYHRVDDSTEYGNRGSLVEL